MDDPDYVAELASCLAGAERCADLCEQLLGDLGDGSQPQLVRALVAPTAVARVLVELDDPGPELVLATARLCAETAATAVGELERLDLLAAEEALQALRDCAACCSRLAAAA